MGAESTIASSLRRDERVKDIFFTPMNAASRAFLNAKDFGVAYKYTFNARKYQEI